MSACLMSLTYGNWMAGQLGIGWRIDADNQALLTGYDPQAMVDDVLEVPGVSYVIFNLSDPAYGDNYLAPHSVLDAINDGLNPYTGFPDPAYVDNPAGLPSPVSGRDLFGEMAQLFQDNGIKVIAYMATQGPTMLKHGLNSGNVYDAIEDPVTGDVTSVSYDNWEAFVKNEYGITGTPTYDDYTRAYAEVIVDEYAARYGALIDGYWFDNGTMDAALLKSIIETHNPNVVATYNSQSGLSDYADGHPTPVVQERASNDINYDYLIKPVECSQDGYIDHDGGVSLGHAFMMLQWRWNSGELVWLNEEGGDYTNGKDIDDNGQVGDQLTDKAADWMERMLNAGGAWTWNLDVGDVVELSLIHI